MALQYVTGKILNNKFVIDTGNPSSTSINVILLNDDFRFIKQEDAIAYIQQENSFVNTNNKSASMFYYDPINRQLCVNAFQIASTTGSAAEKLTTALPADSHTNGFLAAAVNINTLPAGSSFPSSRSVDTGIFAIGYDGEGNKITFANKLLVAFSTQNIKDPTVASSVGACYIGKLSPAYKTNEIVLVGNLTGRARDDDNCMYPFMVIIAHSVSKKIIGISNMQNYFMTSGSADQTIFLQIQDTGTLQATVSGLPSQGGSPVVTATVPCIANWQLADPAGGFSETSVYVIKAKNTTSGRNNVYCDASYDYKLHVSNGFVMNTSALVVPVADTFAYSGAAAAIGDLSVLAGSMADGKAFPSDILVKKEKLVGLELEYIVTNNPVVAVNSAITFGADFKWTGSQAKISGKLKLMASRASFNSAYNLSSGQDNLQNCLRAMVFNYLIDVDTGKSIDIKSYIDPTYNVPAHFYIKIPGESALLASNSLELNETSVLISSLSSSIWVEARAFSDLAISVSSESGGSSDYVPSTVIGSRYTTRNFRVTGPFASLPLKEITDNGLDVSMAINGSSGSGGSNPLLYIDNSQSKALAIQDIPPVPSGPASPALAYLIEITNAGINTGNQGQVSADNAYSGNARDNVVSPPVKISISDIPQNELLTSTYAIMKPESGEEYQCLRNGINGAILGKTLGSPQNVSIFPSSAIIQKRLP